jgi:DNA (cytosine-5)-methyltransferase 1
MKSANPQIWMTKEGVIAKAFPVKEEARIQELEIEGNLVEITDNFNKSGKLSPFENTGILIGKKVITARTQPDYEGDFTLLGDVLQNGEVTEDFFIKDKELRNSKTIVFDNGTERTLTTEQEMWTYLKGSKKEKRRTKEGFEYRYSEGAMVYPDALDKPSRTIITGEGGSSPSRFKHVVESSRGLRRLTPIELERLNMFPDDHTKLDGISDTKRAFFMGNALVVGVVEKMAKELSKQINA